MNNTHHQSPEVRRLLSEVERLEVARAKNFIEQGELTLKHVRAKWAGDKKRKAELETKLAKTITSGNALTAEYDLLLKTLEVVADAMEALAK